MEKIEANTSKIHSTNQKIDASIKMFEDSKTSTIKMIEDSKTSTNEKIDSIKVEFIQEIGNVNSKIE